MDKRERERAEKQHYARAKAFFDRSGIPARHRRLKAEEGVLNHPQWQNAYQRALRGLGTGAVKLITGNRGTGKTQLASALTRKACRNLLDVRYLKAVEFFMELRDAMKEHGEKAAVAKFVKPKILIIDALEVRGETPFEDRLLAHTVDMRYDALHDTILITNETKKSFAESYDPSIIDRINETGETIECIWNSFRNVQ